MLVPAIPLGESFDAFTHYFYLAVIFITFALCFFKPKDHSERVLWLPFLILWILAASRDEVGADYIQYYNIFNRAEWSGYYTVAESSLEPGYYYLNALLKTICSYEYFGYISFHFIILFLTYKTIIYYKPNISFPYAMLAYVTVWYLLSFNQIRICIAAAIVGYAIHYLLDKKYWHYFIIVGLTFFIHMSSLIMIFAGLIYLLYKKSPKLAIIGLIVAFVIIFGFMNSITQFIQIDRYQKYISSDVGSRVGFKIIFIYVPLAYWLWIGKKYVKSNIWELCLVFTMFACVIDLSSYRVEMMGRLKTYALVPLLIYVPILIKSLKSKNKTLYSVNCIAAFLYYMIKYYLELPVFYWADLVMPYESLLF